MGEILARFGPLFMAKPFTFMLAALGFVVFLSGIFGPANAVPYFVLQPEIGYIKLGIGLTLLSLSFLINQYVENKSSELAGRCSSQASRPTEFGSVQSLILSESKKRISLKIGLLQDIFEVKPYNCVLLPCDEELSDTCFENLRSSLGSFLNANKLLKAAKAERTRRFGNIIAAQPIGSSIFFSANGINCVVAVNARSALPHRTSVHCAGEVLQAVPSSLSGPNFERIFLPIIGSGKANLLKRHALAALILFAYERLKNSEVREYIISIFVDTLGQPEISPLEQWEILNLLSSLLGDTSYLANDHV